MSFTRRFAMPANFSPTRVFLFVLVVIFLVESIDMVVQPWLIGADRSVVLEMILDASLLMVVVSPTLWWMIILPMRRLIQMRTELLAKVIDAQEEERTRISRDLHDSVGQALAVIRVGLKSIENATDLETAKARCGELRELAATTHEDVGRMARGLRPAVLDDLGLGAALERLGQDVGGAHGLSVTVEIDLDDMRLAPQTELVIFRIAQESLTNAAKHAHAKNARVSVHREASHVVLRVEDDGKGFDPLSISQGLGLSGMHQRAEFLGGTVSVESQEGKGTSVVARIPIAEIGHGKNTNPADR